MRYSRNPKVAAVNFGYDKALLNVQTGKYLYLNETAGRIWDLLEEGSTDNEIAYRLFFEYEIEVDAALIKINQFLTKAVAAGVILEQAEKVDEA